MSNFKKDRVKLLELLKDLVTEEEEKEKVSDRRRYHYLKDIRRELDKWIEELKEKK